MTKHYEDIRLEFEADVEYSIDDGATWVQLPADTPSLIIGNDLADAGGKVKVRSTNVIETLDRTKLGLDLHIYDSFNIKQGQDLTSIENLFRATITNNIRVANVPKLISARNLVYESVVDTFEMINSPLLEDCHAFFYNSVINYIGNIYAPRCNDATHMFASGNYNYIGDVKLGTELLGDSGIGAYEMFSFASIKNFPNIYLNISAIRNSSSSSTNYYNSDGMFQNFSTPYVLYNKLLFKQCSTNSGNMSPLVYGFRGSSFKFAGFDIINLNTRESSPFSSTYVNTNHNCYPFSRIKTINAPTSNWDYGYTNPKLTSADRYQFDGVSAHLLIYPNWMPEIMVLSSHTDKLFVKNKVSMGAVGLYNKSIDSNLVLEEQTSVREFYQTSATSTTDMTGIYDTSEVAFARNGRIAVRNGTSIKVFDDTNTLIFDCTVPSNLLAFQLNTEGTKLFVAYGGKFDEAGDAVQQLAGSINVYNTADGALLTTKDMGTRANAYIVGVYNTSDDCNLHVVFTTYREDQILLDVSYIETLTPVNYGLIETTELPFVVDYVCNHHVEDNEFTCINRLTGNVARCFGK